MKGRCWQWHAAVHVKDSGCTCYIIISGMMYPYMKQRWIVRHAIRGNKSNTVYFEGFPMGIVRCNKLAGIQTSSGYVVRQSFEAVLLNFTLRIGFRVGFHLAQAA
jgi:hypothetical protein